MLNLVSIYNMIILLCTFFALPAKAVWVSIERDNSTVVDAANVLGCLRNNGFPENATIAISNSRALCIYNQRDSINVANAKKVAARCYWDYGFNISYMTFWYAEIPEDLHILGTLADMTENWSQLPSFGRQRVSEMSSTVDSGFHGTNITYAENHEQYLNHYSTMMAVNEWVLVSNQAMLSYKYI